jgi:ElaB/YqjD/DUF883 family membrane-anchored ribosome-binding protein
MPVRQSSPGNRESNPNLAPRASSNNASAAAATAPATIAAQETADTSATAELPVAIEESRDKGEATEKTKATEQCSESEPWGSQLVTHFGVERDKMKRTRGTAQQVQDEISNIVDELASLGRVLQHDASAETKAAIQSLRQRADKLAEVAGSLTEGGLEAARNTVSYARDTIAEGPFVSTGAAFGLGLGVGVLLARLMRR